jgi:hypothetical protein
MTVSLLGIPRVGNNFVPHRQYDLTYFWLICYVCGAYSDMGVDNRLFWDEKVDLQELPWHRPIFFRPRQPSSSTTQLIHYTASQVTHNCHSYITKHLFHISEDFNGSRTSQKASYKGGRCRRKEAQHSTVHSSFSSSNWFEGQMQRRELVGITLGFFQMRQKSFPKASENMGTHNRSGSSQSGCRPKESDGTLAWSSGWENHSLGTVCIRKMKHSGNSLLVLVKT